MAVLAPMPSVSVSTATSVKTGCLRRERSAYRTSCMALGWTGSAAKKLWRRIPATLKGSPYTCYSKCRATPFQGRREGRDDHVVGERTSEMYDNHCLPPAPQWHVACSTSN